jgi:hypothetical protein
LDGDREGELADTVRCVCKMAPVPTTSIIYNNQRTGAIAAEMSLGSLRPRWPKQGYSSNPINNESKTCMRVRTTTHVTVFLLKSPLTEIDKYHCGT